MASGGQLGAPDSSAGAAATRNRESSRKGTDAAEHRFELAGTCGQRLDDEGRVSAQLYANALAAQRDARVQRSDRPEIECRFDGPRIVTVAVATRGLILFDSKAQHARAIVMANRQLDQHGVHLIRRRVRDLHGRQPRECAVGLVRELVKLLIRRIEQRECRG